jgi:HAD superfamily hydrolase (TIGR01549 family)
MPQISAAIFDWDKTLVESMTGIRIATNYALEEMRKKGFKVEIGYTDKGYAQWTDEETQVRFSSTSSDFFKNTFGSFGDDVAAEALSLWREKLTEVHLDTLEVLDGATKTLSLLLEKNIPVAIVSNKDEDLLKTEVEAVMGSDAAKIVVRGSVDGRRGKPYPDPIFDALAELNVSSSSTVWMVGDSVSDVKAGIKSGSYPVLFSKVNCRAVKTLQNDPERQSVLSGRAVGHVVGHDALQKLISEAEIVRAQPYNAANNPHFICKPPESGK